MPLKYLKSALRLAVALTFIQGCQNRSTVVVHEKESARDSRAQTANQENGNQNGGMDGGGGRAVVCRSLNGKIKSAELLDFYEAKYQFGLKISNSNNGYMDQAEKVLINLGTGRGLDFLKYDFLAVAKSINKLKKILPATIALKEINDSHEVLIPKGCQVEQAANYLDRGSILIDGDIWDHFDEQNKAGLIVHETVYLSFRNLAGATNSIHARKAVGLAFSGLVTIDFKKDLPQTNLIFCESVESEKPTAYWIYQHVDPKFVVIQFDKIDGILMLTKTSMTASAKAFAQVGNFARYYGNISDSLIERELMIGFKDGSSMGMRYVGAVKNWKDPSVPTVCRKM